MADRMAQRAAPPVRRMILRVDGDQTPHIHPLVMQQHVLTVAADLERCARCGPRAADRNRIAAERRVVAERIVGVNRAMPRRVSNDMAEGPSVVRFRDGVSSQLPKMSLRGGKDAVVRPAWAGPFTLNVRPSGNSTVSKKHMCGSWRDIGPVTRIVVPAFNIDDVIPLRDRVTPCDPQTY